MATRRGRFGPDAQSYTVTDTLISLIWAFGSIFSFVLAIFLATLAFWAFGQKETRFVRTTRVVSETLAAPIPSLAGASMAAGGSISSQPQYQASPDSQTSAPAGQQVASSAPNEVAQTADTNLVQAVSPRDSAQSTASAEGTKTVDAVASVDQQASALVPMSSSTTTRVVQREVSDSSRVLIRPIEVFVISGSLAAAAILLILLGILWWLWFKAAQRGIVVAPAQDTIEFPGGGIVANRMGDYFSFSWWTQRCRRYTGKLSDIVAIDGSTTTTVTASERDVSSTNSHQVSVTFTWGIVQFVFAGNGREKCDQLFNVLRSVNSMGFPVVHG